MTPDLWLECIDFLAGALGFGCVIGFVAALLG